MESDLEHYLHNIGLSTSMLQATPSAQVKLALKFYKRFCDDW